MSCKCFMFLKYVYLHFYILRVFHCRCVLKEWRVADMGFIPFHLFIYMLCIFRYLSCVCVCFSSFSCCCCFFVSIPVRLTSSFRNVPRFVNYNNNDDNHDDDDDADDYECLCANPTTNKPSQPTRWTPLPLPLPSLPPEMNKQRFCWIEFMHINTHTHTGPLGEHQKIFIHSQPKQMTIKHVFDAKPAT